jgi:hypothetical protein
MKVAGAILLLGVLFFGCLFFLLAFALRLGVNERSAPDMLKISLRFAGVATAVFAVIWFFAHRS